MNQTYRLLGQHIKTARTQIRLSQAELAHQMGFSSHQIVSQIEKGEREIKSHELFRIAKILCIDFYRLLSLTEVSKNPVILWRKKGNDESRLSKERKFLEKCKEYSTLEKLSSYGAQRQLPRAEIQIFADFDNSAKLAQKCSEELNLGSRPAVSLQPLLENNYGVKIWHMDLEDDGSAACTLGDFGPAILMNRKEAPWRRNYNLAHELFHLITWGAPPPESLDSNQKNWEKIEKLAEVFASNLLLPADALGAMFDEKMARGKITLVDLVAIARYFDVSTAALLYRLLNLRRLDRETVENLLNSPRFKGLDRSSMIGFWWTPPEIPERFVTLAFLAYQKGQCSRMRLAKYLEVSLFDLPDFLLKYGLNDRENYQTEVAVAGC